MKENGKAREGKEERWQILKATDVVGGALALVIGKTCDKAIHLALLSPVSPSCMTL